MTPIVSRLHLKEGMALDMKYFIQSYVKQSIKGVFAWLVFFIVYHLFLVCF